MTDGTYVITVRGVAGPWVRAFFDDTEVSVMGDTTVLRRAGTDQAALHGPLPDRTPERGTGAVFREVSRNGGQHSR